MYSQRMYKTVINKGQESNEINTTPRIVLRNFSMA